MDFDTAYKFISNQLKAEENDVCHQIEYIAVKGKLEALGKIKNINDVSKLCNQKELCHFPNFNGEYQLRQMFEKALGVKLLVPQQPSYEKKLVQSLITDYITNPEIESLTKSLSVAVIENTFVDFDNENFLTK